MINGPASTDHLPREAAELLTDYEITDVMINIGGGFVSRLGLLFRYADPVNQAKLKATFADAWRTYAALALAARERVS